MVSRILMETMNTFIQTFVDTRTKTYVNVLKMPKNEVEAQLPLILENSIIFQNSSFKHFLIDVYKIY